MRPEVTIAETMAFQVSEDDPDPWPPSLEFEETSDPCTDAANAQRFARKFGRNLLYIDPLGWHRWSGSYWTDGKMYADRCAQELGATIRADSIEHSVRASDMTLSRPERDEAHRRAEALLRWAKTSESASRIEAAKNLATAHMHVQVADIDRHPWLLNCGNGTLDLRTFELRQPRRSDLLTKCTHVQFEPHAKCELWKRVMQDVCCGDAELVRYVQRVFGYCATGDVSEQKMFIFNGAGANGKDTVLTRVQHALGDYAGLAAPNLLIESRSGRHPTEVADLAGMRLAIASESNENGRLNEVGVKRFVGSESLKARRMRQDFYEFPVQFKLILMTNHRPVIEGSDYGIWRRLNLVPFNAVFKGATRDTELPQKLDKEMPGILRWIVEGCQEWRRIGLDPPNIVKEATKQYHADQDVLRDFFDSRCRFNPASQVTAKAFYSAYERWCGDNGERAKSATWLWPKLQERGVSKERLSTGIVYRGIGLSGSCRE